MVLKGYVVRFGDRFVDGGLTIDKHTRVAAPGLVAVQLGHGRRDRYRYAYWGSDITWPDGRADVDMGLSDEWSRSLGLAWARRDDGELGVDDEGVWVRVPVRRDAVAAVAALAGRRYAGAWLVGVPVGSMGA